MKAYLILIALFCCITCQNTDQAYDSNSLSLAQANKIKVKVYSDYKKDLLSNRSKEMIDQVITINNRQIKFDLRFFGKKLKDGWSLFISLHGGGETTEEKNNTYWNRHKTLYELENGILFTPRSPTNTWNMWHQSHVDTFFNRIIQNMIAFHDVDPNRVYIMGRSAGGDGIYQVAPRMADRFAAAAMSAGHPNEASPLGLRNIAFAIHMGENDYLYDRNTVAIQWGNQLAELREKDPGGYPHLVKIYKDKGHWMDNLEASALIWMSDFVRKPYPDKIMWKQDDVLHKRFYWLKNEEPSVGDLIEAEINGQVIDIKSSSSSKLVILLNDDFIDMNKKVVVNYLDTELFNGLVSRSKKVIERTTKEYGDPYGIYYGEIYISLAN